MLTLNKPEEEKDASLEVFGYLMMLSSACLYGLQRALIWIYSSYNY